MGPFWARAVFVVTRKGALILHYLRPDGRWAIARADLRSLTSTGFLLTHAAIAPTQGMEALPFLVSKNLSNTAQTASSWLRYKMLAAKFLSIS